MPHSSAPFLWPLRLIAVGSLVVPALLFSYATWDTYRTLDAAAQERIERTLDVLHEHALGSLQTVERSIAEINEVLRGLSDADIRVREADLSLRFKRTQQTLPQIESIWAFDRDGHPLVSGTILPVPRTLNNSDRSYFSVHRAALRGTFIGEVVRARVGALQFFVVSGRRDGPRAGEFHGVIGVTVTPQHFAEFYRKLSAGADAFALVRADGSLLARFPEVAAERLTTPSEITPALAGSPHEGALVATSPLDGTERRTGYRKLAGFPVYVQAGIETAALRQSFWAMVLTQFAIGLPAVLGMFGLAVFALRRGERFQEETARREQAENALKQAQRLEALGQLTGGVAHDFNNLLMVVSGSAQRIKRAVPAETLPPRALEAIETAVKRGSALTRQLLSFSRRQAHEPAVLDLHERLPIIQQMLQSSLRGDIALDIALPDGLWRTKVDAGEFELALLNLVVNARDAMSGGGRLTLSARNAVCVKPNPLNLAGEFLALSVGDTGTGMPPEVAARVFEPFFTTKDIGKGTGLGLSQVYGFATQAGGSVELESASGAGTTVTLYLPRSTDTADASGATTGEHSAHPVAARGSILLVEDNDEVADLTKHLLLECGYDVTRAATVATARDLIATHTFDAVLSDIVMPGGSDGLDLARWIRQTRGDRLPVILATGYSAKASLAASEGFPILRKPYELHVLRRALAEVRERPPARAP